jgi:hypothetical protein
LNYALLCRQEPVTEAEGAAPVKHAALYLRVSSLDYHPETQLYDLRQMAARRGYEIMGAIAELERT